MEYYFNRTVQGEFDEVIEKITSQLEEEGFGVLTDIDLKKKFSEKLEKDFRKYRILGACNAPYAYKALQSEDKVGTMLPCNVIVQETQSGKIEVAAVNPLASMQAINNKELEGIAKEIADKLKKAVDSL